MPSSTSEAETRDRPGRAGENDAYVYEAVTTRSRWGPPRALAALAGILIIAGGAWFGVTRLHASSTPPRPAGAALEVTTWQFGVAIRPRGIFRIPLVLRNGSDSPITLGTVRAVFSLHGAPVYPLGTAWEPFRACDASPFGCPTQVANAPPARDQLHAPFQLAPRTFAYAWAAFRLGSCHAVAARVHPNDLGANPNFVRAIVVTYRTPSGMTVLQKLPRLRFALDQLGIYEHCR